jgi:hypothetical protein
VNSKYIVPVLILAGLVYSVQYNQKSTLDFITNEKKIYAPEDIVTSLTPEQSKQVYNYLAAFDANNATTSTPDLEVILSNYSDNEDQYQSVVNALPISDSQKYETGFSLFKHKIPMWIFLLSLLGLAVWGYRQNLSLIPMLGLISCLYMMAELSVWNWIYFTIWLLIGLVIYFGYSQKNSKLNTIE